MPDLDDDSWLVEFKPGWPDVFPGGLIVIRSTVRTNPETTDEDEWDDNGQILRLVIHGARHPGTPKFGLIADLTIKSEDAFAGVTVLMPLLIRDEPEEVLTTELADELLLQYGEWAAALLYDHAAMAMRAQLASGAFDLEVPYDAPRPEVHTFAQDADDKVAPEEEAESDVLDQSTGSDPS